MTSKQITKDNAYDALDPTDFPAMMNVDRYNDRSTAFDKIISATHDHFWDPLDKKYIDFSEPSTSRMKPFFPMSSSRFSRRSWAKSCPVATASSLQTNPHAGSSRRSCMASRGPCRCRPRSATS
jgi:hypothetical protein